MPRYEYKCERCGEKQIHIHPMAEAVPDNGRGCIYCPGKVKRIIGANPTKWTSSYHQPGLEDSKQRRFLDPEKRAKDKDDMAAFKGSGNRRYLKRITRRAKRV